MKDGEFLTVTLNSFGLRLLVLDWVTMGCESGLVVARTCVSDRLVTSVCCDVKGSGSEGCIGCHTEVRGREVRHW